MHYTGVDPFTRQQAYMAKQLSDRRLKRVLLQYFKPEKWFEARRRSRGPTRAMPLL